jgi:hypothetical protein
MIASARRIGTDMLGRFLQHQLLKDARPLRFARGYLR